MRARQFLIEYIDFNKEKFQKRVAQDNSAAMFVELPIEEWDFPEWLKEHDPTQNNKYINWMITRYIKGGIQRLEDIPAKVTPALELYSRLALKKKLEPEHRDINRIKDLDGLLDVAAYYREKFKDEEEDVTVSKKDKSKNIEKEMYDDGEAKLLFNDSEYKIVSPVTHRASCYFGKNTRWCTTAENSPGMHSSYTRQGPLIIILHKPTNTRWQFHSPSNQYMDEEDHPIHLQEFFENHPKVAVFFLQYGKKEDDEGISKSITSEVSLLFKKVPVSPAGKVLGMDDLKTLRPESVTPVINGILDETGHSILDVRDGHVVIQKWKEIRDFASDLENTTGKWDRGGENPSIHNALSSIEDMDHMPDVQDHDIESFLDYNSTPELDALMEKAIKAELDRLGVDYEDYEDDESIHSLFKILYNEEGHGNEVHDAIDTGVRYGLEAGYHDEVYKDTWAAINSFETTYGGRLVGKNGEIQYDTEVFLVAEFGFFMDFMEADPDFNVSLEYYGWIGEDFVENSNGFVEQPRYGWQGFSKEAAIEHITTELEHYLNN